MNIALIIAGGSGNRMGQTGYRQVVCQLVGEEKRKGSDPITRSAYSIDKLSAIGWTIEGSMYEKIQRTIAAIL